jgi:TrmH family RNA methyltransferase
MLNKKEIKDIQSLSQKKFRESLGLFVAEGPKIVAELAAAAPRQVQQVFAVKEWIETNRELAATFQAITITSQELERLSQLQTPNQVLAVLKTFEPAKPIPGTFTLYLDTIQDPGNLGTIIRIADWFGIRQLVCSAGCADRYSSKVVQSTMASLARVAVYEDLEGNWLAAQAAPKYAAVLNGTSLYGHPKTNKGILMIGNESKGLRPEFLALATEKITIPRVGEAESLNAAVATGIILSHLLS